MDWAGALADAHACQCTSRRSTVGGGSRCVTRHVPRLALRPRVRGGIDVRNVVANRRRALEQQADAITLPSQTPLTQWNSVDVPSTLPPAAIMSFGSGKRGATNISGPQDLNILCHLV